MTLSLRNRRPWLSLTVATLLAALAGVGLARPEWWSGLLARAAAQGNSTASSSETSAGAAAESAPAAPANGSTMILAEALARLDRHPAVTARLRQRVRLYGQELVGSGSYQQMGAGAERYFRLELKVQAGDDTLSRVDVCDGRFVWRRMVAADGERLSRVDLRRLGDALAAAGSAAPPAAGRDWLALGGLPRLLAAIEAAYAFDPPRAAVWSGTPVWKLHGTRRPGDDPAAALPAAVTLVLGRDDLFPYRIEFASAEPAAGEGLRPVMILELFEVQFGAALDPLQFAYKPGETEVFDRTDELLIDWGLASPAAGRPPPSGR